MKPSSSLLHLTYCILIWVGSAEFPLKDPCLQTCSNHEITKEVLQSCVSACMEMGFCCGNRLDGDGWTSSNFLSCANGCEIAFYTSNVDECKGSCFKGNKASCMYTHPNIAKSFGKCYKCNCEEDTTKDECARGCEQATKLPGFYEYVEPPENVCNQADIPRFLFGGQSNMVRIMDKIASAVSQIKCLKSLLMFLDYIFINSFLPKFVSLFISNL